MVYLAQRGSSAQRRLFKTNSDASSYMKGEVEFDERRMNDMEFTDVVDEANKLACGLNEEVDKIPVDTGILLTS